MYGQTVERDLLSSRFTNTGGQIATEVALTVVAPETLLMKGKTGAQVLSHADDAGKVLSHVDDFGKVIGQVDNPILKSSNEFMGIEKASDDLLNAISSKDRVIKYASEGSEEMRYLDYIGAEANVGGENMNHILLRSEPSKAGVLEEFLHGTQHKLGIIEKLGTAAAETHVKSFMIRHQKMLGLMDADVNILQRLMDAGL